MNIVVSELREQFPILSSKVNGLPLVYFDNAATTQKPIEVINAVQEYYLHDNANVHRGVHTLSARATDKYENARLKVQKLVNAKNYQEIIFTKGATESINLVANAFLLPLIQEEDEIIVSAMEHHANLVPWLRICQMTNSQLKVIPLNDRGELCLEKLASMISSRTKMIAVNHISNSLGTINDVAYITRLANKHNIPILIDGTQAIPHHLVDVQQLNCDFYVFSGHKAYGPTGIGALFAKKDLLARMSPYQTGGDMIREVSFSEVTYNELPYKFEAGTPNIAGAIGFGAAIDFINKIGIAHIIEYENKLRSYFQDKIVANTDLKIIGDAAHKTSIFSFVMPCAHAHDVATIMNESGIALRAGHHCTMPVMQHFNVPATIRASLCCYNTIEEIDSFFLALAKVKEIFN